MREKLASEGTVVRLNRIKRLFVIAHARSGSTLVTEAIAQHPSIRMYGELFHPDRNVRARIARPLQPYCDGSDGSAYVNGVIDAVERDGYHAAGIKLLYGQAEAPGARSIWELLREDRSIHVLHLKRWNLFASYVSFQVAMRTAMWAVRSEEDVKAAPEPFDIDAEDCAAYFRDIEARQRQLEASVGAQRTLPLQYEWDLCNRFDVAMNKIWSFIGIEAAPVRTSLRKQANRPLQDQIRNFNNVKQSFVGTEYAAYFEVVQKTCGSLAEL